MAELFPDEGLDLLLGIMPRGGASLGTVYLGLFTSQTATTVPAHDALLATQSGVTEASGVSYARQAIAAGSWGSPAAGGGGRQVTAAQVTFPSVDAGGWGTLNGFLLANTASGGIALYYANFDDQTAIVSNANDVIRITPTWTLLGS
jgi:hypothetical protein